jgi:hypothetical protein
MPVKMPKLIRDALINNAKRHIATADAIIEEMGIKGEQLTTTEQDIYIKVYNHEVEYRQSMIDGLEKVEKCTVEGNDFPTSFADMAKQAAESHCCGNCQEDTTEDESEVKVVMGDAEDMPKEVKEAIIKALSK